MPGRDQPGDAGRVILRTAVLADAALLTAWDAEPHVVRCTTDNPDATVARDAGEWESELESPTPHWEHLVAEVDGRPVGAMLIIDPALEPTHYWGDIGLGLRALDIWIGPADALDRGYGSQMMAQAIDRCFADPAVEAIVIDPLTSNADAHRFYRRMGFNAVGRRTFGEDECLVHRLERTEWRSTSTPASTQHGGAA